MSILIVEDDRKVADALREELEAEHCEVSVERSGQEAFIRIERDAFDAALTASSSASWYIDLLENRNSKHEPQPTT